MKHLLPGLAATLCALALTACGSSDHDGPLNAGGGGTANACGDVPGSALASSSALIAYTKQLVGMTSETSEPVALCATALPVDDTAEPAT